MKITFSELLINWMLTAFVTLTYVVIHVVRSNGYVATSSIIMILAYLCGVVISFTSIRKKHRQTVPVQSAAWLSCLWFLVLVVTTILATYMYIKSLIPVTSPHRVQ